jgi:starch synthase (maltosyl-transferring)
MIVYNLFPRLAGRFTAWQRHLERAHDLGFDWVYVNPVQKMGRSGSLYSIADYFALDPVFVDPSSPLDPDAQLRDVIGAARGLGMRVMTDLVINHCAIDSELVEKHPAWFLREHGKVAHPFCQEADGNRVVWRDLAQFDHRHSRDRKGLGAYLSEIVEHLLGLGFEGFRCDAAYLLPGKVWSDLISQVKSRHPEVVFVAETLGCRPDQTRQTALAGFDYVFNSSKWWNFWDAWLFEQYDLIREDAPSIGFPESHDTPRLAEEVHGNLDALKQRYLFTALFSAGVMMPMGFEFGATKRLHVVSTTPADWDETDLGLLEFIRNVNAVKHSFQVFQEDCPTSILPHDNSEILVMWKGSTRSQDEALVILNKDVFARQVFYVDTLRPLVQSGAALACVSPENPLDYVPEPFHYELRPGEAIVLVTRR